MDECGDSDVEGSDAQGEDLGAVDPGDLQEIDIRGKKGNKRKEKTYTGVTEAERNSVHV